MNNKYAVNDQIRAKEIRLISDTGESLGVMTTQEARLLASKSGLDLVAVSIVGNTPVCKILDFGKFKYALSRKERDNAKKMREARVELKEIQLRPNIDSNDLKIKAKRAQGFINDGNKVKIVLKFKGRENAHVDIGRSVALQFLELLENYKFDKPLQHTDRQLLTVISPKLPS